MGKALEGAIRDIDFEDRVYRNEEKTWEEFQKHHPEIMIFYNKKNQVVDIDFPPNIDSSYIEKKNGVVVNVWFHYKGHSYSFPKF